MVGRYSCWWWFDVDGGGGTSVGGWWTMLCGSRGGGGGWCGECGDGCWMVMVAAATEGLVGDVMW